MTLALAVLAAAVAGVLAVAMSSDADFAVPTTVARWQPDVIEHEYRGELTPKSNVWTGVIYRVADDTPVFLADGVNSLGLPGNSDLTMAVEAEVRPDTRFPRVLHLVVGEPPPASGVFLPIEMVWTSGAGVDGSFELDAALQRPADSAFAFHLQCSTGSGDTVVGVVDADLEVHAAWELSDAGTEFDEVSPVDVSCW